MQIPDTKVGFQHIFRVCAQDLDDLNHVNNTIYLKWVQEAAYMHWNLLAPKKLKSQVVWMVLRHEIDYHNQAFLNDLITVYTWIDESKGVKSTRIVHIYKENKVLSTSKTTFCLLDKTSLRPKRISDAILNLFTK